MKQNVNLPYKHTEFDFYFRSSLSLASKVVLLSSKELCLKSGSGDQHILTWFCGVDILVSKPSPEINTWVVLLSGIK